MNVADLFSGIGGFSLGLERAGMHTTAFCERDPFCQRVLARHWPSVPIFPDVRELAGEWLGAVDVICGGFPCTDISLAGRGAGIDGPQSGLWREFARLVGEVRPAYVIVENVAALLGRGMGRVLGELSALGYDAEWHCIPACAIGAPHRRDRVWIVAYPDGSRSPQRVQHQLLVQLPPAVGGNWWAAEPDVGRVAAGIPNRVDRLRALGNSLVPQNRRTPRPRHPPPPRRAPMRIVPITQAEAKNFLWRLAGREGPST